MSKIIIAIDGHSGCGKSSTAKLLAQKLNYTYIDTGAMYRAVTLYLLQNNISFKDRDAIEEALPFIEIKFIWNIESGKNETFLNDENVENEIRKMYISEKVSEVSAIPEVRKAMVAQQRKMGNNKGIVMDGRDIGTNVFPDAELKIFMTADVEVRAKRRQDELLEKGEKVVLEKIIQNLKDRDFQDSTRKENPLLKAENAIIVDTGNHTLVSQVAYILNLVEEKI